MMPCKRTRKVADAVHKEQAENFKNELNRATILTIVSIDNGRFNTET